MHKTDIIAGLFIGEVSAWLILIIFKNIRVEFQLTWALVIILPVLSLAGLWIASILGRKFLFVWQAAKFGLVGVLNTLIDLGVLNLLSFITGVTKGFVIGGVNIPGFSVAVLNSYLWNKLWVFQHKEGLWLDFPQFLVVSIIGIILNGTILVIMTTYVPPIFGLSEQIWLNVAKIVAIPANMIWNFLGYKFIVFRK